MSKNRKPNTILEGVTIEAIAAEGKCLFHHDNYVVFVPFCVPGDVADVEIYRKKHSYAEGRILRFIKKSEVRAEPFCQHFGICGGCKWQNLPYEEQLKAKQTQVTDQLTRIGKVELPEISPILASVKTKEYRNKLEFGCCDRRWFTKEELNDDSLNLAEGNHSAIGFHITGAFDKIYPISKCWLMDDLHNKIRNEIERYAKEIGMTSMMSGHRRACFETSCSATPTLANGCCSYSSITTILTTTSSPNNSCGTSPMSFPKYPLLYTLTIKRETTPLAIKN